MVEIELSTSALHRFWPIITFLAKCPNLPKMDPKCAKYPKVVLGRPVEGRSCKLHGKAPLTGPYTPKWRPNDEEENAIYVAGGGFDKVDGNITILDCGEQIQDEVAMIEEAWVQMSSPSPNLILRLQSFYGVSPCSS